MMKKLSIQINHRSIVFFCSDEALVVRIDLKQNSMIIYITPGQPAQRAKKTTQGEGPKECRTLDLWQLYYHILCLK